MSLRTMVVIQARTGATRLPGKMSMSFFRNRTILELMVDELLRSFSSNELLIATSTSPNDAEIADTAVRLGVPFYRGSEDDVLDRVWQAVSDFELDSVVRVCADNPFLRVSFIEELLSAADVERPDLSDYYSFNLPDGTPTILSHLGLFAEVVRFDTLRQIHATATTQRHREHLTSHILDHPTMYKRRLLPVPNHLLAIDSLRLTVDTTEDFQICKELYEAVEQKYGSTFSAEQLSSTARLRPDLIEAMSQQIVINAKK